MSADKSGERSFDGCFLREARADCAQGRLIATVFDEKDRRLVAAADDLLYACRHALEFLDRLNSGPEDKCEIERMLERAIRKAEGAQ